MSIINTNGQPVSSAPESPAPAPATRVAISPAEMQKLIGAFAQLKHLSSGTILTPRDEAEKAGLISFLNGALLANAEELFGCWVVVQQEYSPLITGFTGLLRRALGRIDAANQQPVATATEVVSSVAPTA